MKRVPFDPTQGYPAGRRYAYRCTRCGATLESRPTHDEPWACACRNVRVDADAGRVSVDDHAAFEVLDREG